MRQSFWALAFLVILAFVLPANAQDQQAKVELYVGYDYVRLNSGGNAFNFNGGSGQFTYNEQAPLMPDLAAQRAAMAKLNFLIGSWSGEARMFRSGSEPLELLQTESAEYKLDGLILEINGIARTKSEGKVVLQALGIISYEDDRHTYRFRAFNDGRWLESDLKLAADEKGISWGFIIGEIRTTSTMRIAANGNWTEPHEITIGTQPVRKLMEVSVSQRNPPR